GVGLGIRSRRGNPRPGGNTADVSGMWVGNRNARQRGQERRDRVLGDVVLRSDALGAKRQSEGAVSEQGAAGRIDVPQPRRALSPQLTRLDGVRTRAVHRSQVALTLGASALKAVNPVDVSRPDGEPIPAGAST